MNISAIIPAAGESTRMKQLQRKPFLSVGGEPILLRTCKMLASQPEINELIIVAHPEDVEKVRDTYTEILGAGTVVIVVAGGECRAESVWNGLCIADPQAELIAVHDAVRPFMSREVCEQLFLTAQKRGAAIPVLPLTDTIKRVEVDKVTETLRRVGVMRVQTPQVFRRELLVEAYEYARETGGLSDRITDDAALVEAMESEVAAVLGDPFNLKITTAADLQLLELFIKEKLVTKL